MRTDGTDAWSSFSGLLELLKVLEDHTVVLPVESDTNRIRHAPGKETS